MQRFALTLPLIAVFPAVATAQPDPPTEPPADPPVAPAPTVEAMPSPAPDSPRPPPVDTKVVVAAPVEAKPNAGYDKGLFLRSDDGKYVLKIKGRIQPFYLLRRFDTPAKDYRNQLEVRRARLTLSGNAHSKDFTYKFQIDFGRGNVTLRDVHFDLKLGKATWLRVGQWKRPFSRQQIASSGDVELTDRAITDRAFGAGRDVGIALRNDYEKSPDFEWTVGVFNGVGEAPRVSGTVTVDPMTNMGTITSFSSSNVPAKFRPALVGRVGINRNGIEGYSEADLEGGPARFGVGASVALEGDFDDDDASTQKAQLDYMFKAHGFSSTGGLYAQTEQTDDNIADAEVALVGFHVQAGYMLNDKWQAAGRYAYTNDPRQKAKTSDDQQEISVGANFFGYGKGHDAKIAAAIRLIKSGDASFTDVILLEVGSNVVW